MLKLIKLTISLLFPGVLGFVLITLFSTLILKTSIPESLTMLFSIIAICLISIFATILNTYMYKVKGIYVALFSFVVIILYKTIITIVMQNSLNFSLKGIVGIMFTALFCFVGCLVGVNTKK